MFANTIGMVCVCSSKIAVEGVLDDNMSLGCSETSSLAACRREIRDRIRSQRYSNFIFWSSVQPSFTRPSRSAVSHA